MTVFEWVTFGVEIVTAVAILFAVLQFVGGRTQRHREFENLYVKRYWELLDMMSFKLYVNQPIRRISAGDRRAVHAYLRLCEDELDLRTQGFITDRTWAIWSEGMRAQLRSGPYHSELQKLGPGDLPALRYFLLSGRDPLAWWKPKRWWSGLL